MTDRHLESKQSQLSSISVKSFTEKARLYRNPQRRLRLCERTGPTGSNSRTGADCIDFNRFRLLPRQWRCTIADIASNHAVATITRTAMLNHRKDTERRGSETRRRRRTTSSWPNNVKGYAGSFRNSTKGQESSLTAGHPQNCHPNAPGARGDRDKLLILIGSLPEHSNQAGWNRGVRPHDGGSSPC